MKVLSLFDGMACGAIAFTELGIPIERYVAYEVDKYAIKSATHNFPNIEERGDVFNADFSEFEGFDFLIGGSPCTYWSIAQSPDKRETTASGLGWELFSQYVKALHAVKPRYFLYENNKSMSKAIRNSIRETFGFEEICINSALVSAQNRQRFYWVGKRNADGTYSKVNIEQPEDRGILLKDVLESNGEPINPAKGEKCRTLVASYYKAAENPFSSYGSERGRQRIAEYISSAEPLNPTVDGKGRALIAGYHKQGLKNILKVTGYGSSGVAQPIRVGCMPSPDGTIKNSQGMRIYSVEGKAVNQTAQGGGMGAKTGLYAEPVCVAQRGRYTDTGNRHAKSNGKIEQFYEARTDGKSNCISTVQKDNNIAEPLIVPEATKQGYAVIQQGDCVDLTQPNSKTRRGRSMKDKSNCLTTSPQYYQYCGKQHTVYTVKDGQITIKDKQYPIKLVDGQYIIRKLTVTECKRLQTVPEWYEFPVSDTRAYQQLGNGWTIEVVKWLLNACIENKQMIEQQALF